MPLKILTLNYNNKILIILLGVLSFYLNYHYGFIGVMPMDNTVLFNGGFRVLKGYVPFTDYWLVTGPFLDYLNAFFFKFLGISWRTYIIHSSLFNSFFALASYLVLNKIGLSQLFSFIYALLISLLFYPVVGTPFVDHHSTFFMILGFYCLILSLKTKNYNYCILIPIFLFFSFLSKQTPAAYGIITISFFILLISYLLPTKRRQILNKFLTGVAIAFVLLIIFFLITKINIDEFFQQYILFGSSIGADRLSEYRFSLINEIIKFKFISYFIFFILIITFILKKKNKLSLDSLFILFLSISLSVLLIFHQMISMNQNFIFFLIPFLCGVAQAFYNKAFSKDYLLIISFLICLIAVSKYHLRFNEERKFNELENIDISKFVEAEMIDKKLKGLRWVTYLMPENPKKEVDGIVEVINYLKKDKLKKILITDYQIISPILDIYDNSPNQWHHPSVSFPLKGQKYYDIYKNYFIKKIKKYKIDYIFEARSDEKIITSLILNENCFSKQRVSYLLIKLKLNFNCEDLR